jgi:hypothetical protein
MSFAAAQEAALPVAQPGRNQADTVLGILAFADMQSRLHRKVLGALPSRPAAHADLGDKSISHLEARIG